MREERQRRSMDDELKEIEARCAVGGVWALSNADAEWLIARVRELESNLLDATEERDELKGKLANRTRIEHEGRAHLRAQLDALGKNNIALHKERDELRAKRKMKTMLQELEEGIEQRKHDRRDLFAAAALTGLLAGGGRRSESVADDAWAMANLMVEREPNEPEGA